LKNGSNEERAQTILQKTKYWVFDARQCIDRIAPQLVPGGIVVFDDYSSYSGCTRAVDEWLTRDVSLEKIFHRRSLGVRRLIN
jgi:Macrocin-O-methyltransferase (TylF)